MQAYTSVSHGIDGLGHRRSTTLIGLRRTASYPDIMMLMAIANGTMPVAWRLGLLVTTHCDWGTSDLMVMLDRYISNKNSQVEQDRQARCGKNSAFKTG